jgi:hypothetical protein
MAKQNPGCSAVKALALALASLLFCLASAVFAQEGPRPASTTTTITNLAQFWALSSTAGDQEYPTRMQLLINYHDSEWKMIWVGSDRGGRELSDKGRSSRVHSDGPGKGANFTLHLPVQPESSTQVLET